MALGGVSHVSRDRSEFHAEFQLYIKYQEHRTEHCTLDSARTRDREMGVTGYLDTVTEHALHAVSAVLVSLSVYSICMQHRPWTILCWWSSSRASQGTGMPRPKTGTYDRVHPKTRAPTRTLSVECMVERDSTCTCAARNMYPFKHRERRELRYRSRRCCKTFRRRSWCEEGRRTRDRRDAAPP